MLSSKILVVDEDPFVRMLLGMVLFELNCPTVLEAEKGMEALVLAKQAKPDLVLLASNLSGELTGFEVCRQLKADPSLARVLVMMITSYGRSAEMKQCQAAGADEICPKPFDVAVLRVKLARLLNHIQQQYLA